MMKIRLYVISTILILTWVYANELSSIETVNEAIVQANDDSFYYLEARRRGGKGKRDRRRGGNGLR